MILQVKMEDKTVFGQLQHKYIEKEKYIGRKLINREI